MSYPTSTKPPIEVAFFHWKTMPFPISAMSTPFINHMVQEMYAWEAKQHTNPNLATDEEIMDFYIAYMGYPQ